MNNVITQELSIADALDFEFIFNQFMKVSLLLDIGDDAQRYDYFCADFCELFNECFD